MPYKSSTDWLQGLQELLEMVQSLCGYAYVHFFRGKKLQGWPTLQSNM